MSFVESDPIAKQLGSIGGKATFGALKGTAKLTDAQVREIRAADDSQNSIAKRFGISRRQVSRIRRREQWAHVY